MTTSIKKKVAALSPVVSAILVILVQEREQFHVTFSKKYESVYIHVADRKIRVACHSHSAKENSTLLIKVCGGKVFYDHNVVVQFEGVSAMLQLNFTTVDSPRYLEVYDKERVSELL